jgi:hypothetical protein
MISTPILCIFCSEIIDINADQQNSDKDIICTDSSKTFLCDDLPKYNTTKK